MRLIYMFYPFFYDTKRFLAVVKEHCANNTRIFNKTGNEEDMPEEMKEIACEMASYFSKYHKFLEAICDNPFILL